MGGQMNHSRSYQVGRSCGEIRGTPPSVHWIQPSAKIHNLFGWTATKCRQTNQIYTYQNIHTNGK